MLVGLRSWGDIPENSFPLCSQVNPEASLSSWDLYGAPSLKLSEIKKKSPASQAPTMKRVSEPAEIL